MVCYSLSQAVGIPAMLVAAVLLTAAAASAAYTVYRFDRMHRDAKKMELAAEASYAEAGSALLLTSYIDVWEGNRTGSVQTMCPLVY